MQTLGSFAVTIDGVVVGGFGYAKVRALLVYLAFTPAQPHARSVLAALLWPEQTEANARGSLSQALLTLRSALQDRQAAEPLLLSDAQHVWLNPRCVVELDAATLLRLLTESQTHQHRSWRTCERCADRLRHAVDAYHGAFLEDVSVPDSAAFEEWVTVQRSRLLQAALSGLERLVERAVWCGAVHDAIQHARRLVELEPWQERSQRTLIQLLALDGQTAAALAQLHHLQTVLDQELGSEPEPATLALGEQIRRGTLADLRQEPPAFLVPPPAVPLVGRRATLAALCALVRADTTRAITLVGPGGIGKTRLALEAAQALRYDFEEGVAFVELAALTDAAQVPGAIARVLGIKERAQSPIVETLRAALRDRHTLLILDNAEHVIRAATLVADLLTAAPHLRVLVTSRAPLMIRAEQQFVLEPLAEDEAVQLFYQRAHAAGAALSADERSVYAAICEHLDRLPLAIELVAVHARTRTPHELLNQLDRAPLAIATGPVDIPPRHRSLRHAIQWSYDLLHTDEQRAFRALGAFAGGCTVEAVQAVLGPACDAALLADALVRASLVQRQVVAEQTRLVLLETIRAFALEQLHAHNEVAIAQEHHANYYATFAMTAYEQLLRPVAPQWGAWIAAELPNLRAAFDWAQAHGRPELALQLSTGVWRFHCSYHQGAPVMGLAQLETALVDREQVPLDLQAKALRAAGTLAGAVNDYHGARRWFEAAIDVAWRLGDQTVLQAAMTNFGYALLEQGELEEARVHLEVSRSLAERSPEPWTAKYPLGMLAGLHMRLGEFDTAQALSEAGLRLNEQRQDPEGTADALRTLGQIMHAQGRHERARQLADEALARHAQLNHPHGMGLDERLLGDLARAAGDLTGALTHYQRSLDLWRDREHVLESATVFDRIAAVLSQCNEPARAVTLLSSAAAIRRHAGARLTAQEQAACNQTADACRAVLGDAAFADAWAEGGQRVS